MGSVVVAEVRSAKVADWDRQKLPIGVGGGVDRREFKGKSDRQKLPIASDGGVEAVAGGVGVDAVVAR